METILSVSQAHQRAVIEESVGKILEIIGEDKNREGLKRTPHRYAKFLLEFLSPPNFNFTTFENEARISDNNLILQSGIEFFSLCEHHLLPFHGTATVAYVPGERLIGLSKLARTVEHFSRRLQNQERITHQIAEYISEQLNPRGVAVFMKARHMCMSMRGACCPAETSTTFFTGILSQDTDLQRRFLEQCR